MQDYKKLLVWEKSHLFVMEVYRVTKQFPKEELYALTSQLRRASSSIPFNIAEGCGRQTKSDFAHFLNMAMGSANEADYQLYLSRCLEYTSEENYLTINALLAEVKAMLISLIDKVRT